MKKTLHVAVVQKRSKNQDFTANTQYALQILEEAAERKADIVLFPECFLTGYELPITNAEALPEDSHYIQAVCRKAKELQIGAVITALTRGSEKPRNTAFLIDRTGTILLQYAKVHTCDFADEACLESGDAFEVCEFDGVKIGIMICYDREYPESARVLMMKGAELILVPNDCGAMRPRVQALSTRAYENMVGVAMANPPGENAGCSCAFSPICWNENGNCVDNTLLLANDKADEIFAANFDIAALRNYRSHEMMGNTFRKVKAYGELLNTKIAPPFVRSGQN